MIVFDLKCAQNHVFEAWFGSSNDYEEQKARGLLACPVCGDLDIGKGVMAPAVAAKSNRAQIWAPSVPGTPPSAPVTNQTPDPQQMRAIMEALATAQSKALEDSQWVGRAFAEKARAMHYGEVAHGSIHGEVAPQEAKALMEEGVPVAPLPFPVIPPDAKN